MVQYLIIFGAMLVPLVSGFESSQPVRSAYQPPASSTFLSEQISH
jgi:hypothetical protein